MKHLLKRVGLVAVVGLLSACGDGKGHDTDSGDKDTGLDETTREAYRLSDEAAAEVEDDLVIGNTDFAVNLFKALVDEAPTENVFLSPVSVSVALSMTMNGAAGDTLSGMQAALSLSNLTMTDINSQFQSLLDSLQHADEDVTLTLANSIWLNPGYPVKESFIEAVQNWYSSDVFDADSPDTINAWIADETGGHITNMIDQFPDDLVMYLVNAIYFKGAWTTTFDTDDTYKGSFETAGGVNVNVEMMAFTDMKDYEAYTDASVTAVRLSYGRDKIAMYAVAPSEWGEGSIDDFLDTLTGEGLDSIIADISPTELGGVHLPKFKIAYEKKLDDILKAFGMSAAYVGGFDNMTDPQDDNPYISMVKHKAFIEVNEQGTEAAAATVAEMVNESAPMVFMANKPFVFFIRDDRNGTILFMGKVADPTA